MTHVTAFDQGLILLIALSTIYFRKPLLFFPSLLYHWKKETNIVNKRAFALLTEMKDSYNEDLPTLFIIGGMNVQTNEHVKEVEIYDKYSKIWKFYKNLPSELLNQYGPDSGCIGTFEDSVIIVGNSIFALDWRTWDHEVLSAVPKTSIGTKCSGNIKIKIK